MLSSFKRYLALPYKMESLKDLALRAKTQDSLVCLGCAEDARAALPKAGFRG